MITLYLTATEKEMFDRLPVSLKEGWKVEVQSEDGYETPEELEMRGEMAHITMGKNPKVAELLKKFEESGEVSSIDWAELPEEVLMDFFFTIGASGIGGIIEYILAEAKEDKDVADAAQLSSIRARITELNTADISTL